MTSHFTWDAPGPSKGRDSNRRTACHADAKAAALYFAFVFGASFVPGPLRISFLVPALGIRVAELIETPIMLVVIHLAAPSVIRLLAILLASRRLTVGFRALGLLVAAEFTVVLWLRGFTIREYLASRDPVSGTVYLVMLGVFAVMPAFVSRK